MLLLKCCNAGQKRSRYSDMLMYQHCGRPSVACLESSRKAEAPTASWIFHAYEQIPAIMEFYNIR